MNKQTSMTKIEEIELGLDQGEDLKLIGNEGAMELHQTNQANTDYGDQSVVSFSVDDWETIKTTIDFYFKTAGGVNK